MAEDFSLIAVDVDGSLANPVMRWAVILWGIAVAVTLIVIYRNKTSRLYRLTAASAILVGATLVSPFANRGIAMAVYQITSKPGVMVGFFGGPPPWASPLVGLALFGAVALVMGRSSSQQGIKDDEGVR
jgi:hypothetical protein